MTLDNRLHLVAFLTACLFTPWHAGWAQDAPSGDKPGPVPRITLGEVIGAPGEGVMVPLYYSADSTSPLNSFVVEIEYVSNNLKFQKTAAGPAAEKAGARAEAQLSELSPDEKGVTRSRLRLAISMGEKPPSAGLPEGLLAFLLFQLSTEAKPFVIRLNPAVISAEDLSQPPRKVGTLSAQPGTVTVERGEMVPAISCFFFTH